MKVTRRELAQLIKEELDGLLSEQAQRLSPSWEEAIAVDRAYPGPHLRAEPLGRDHPGVKKLLQKEKQRAAAQKASAWITDQAAALAAAMGQETQELQSPLQRAIDAGPQKDLMGPPLRAQFDITPEGWKDLESREDWEAEISALEDAPGDIRLTPMFEAITKAVKEALTKKKA